jgi:hypothetical protein
MNKKERIKTMKIYPINDYPNYEEKKQLGFTCKDILIKNNCRVIKLNEFRKPQKGEWYLSGAIVKGYKAMENLSSEYHICKLVRVKTKHITVETIISECNK